MSTDPPSVPPRGGGPFPALPEPQALRVVVADDNPVVRAGLTALLTGRADIEVVAEAADGRQAVEAAAAHRPDVVLLDVRMPGVDGISALPYLVGLAPVLMLTYSRESEIVREALRLGAGGYLVHGEFTAEQLVAAVRDVREGRAHFTATPATALLQQVRGGAAPGHGPAYGPGRGPAPEWPPAGPGPTAHRPGAGEPPTEYLQPQHPASQMQPFVAQSSSGHSKPAPADRARHGLSRREEEVMELIAAGMSNQQIAAACFISEKTVKNHINRIFAKLHAASRSEAIATWLGTARNRTAGGHRD
ncbi:response regulator [Streptomyces sp. SCUT-3]|uniref:response regulator transcription factor n=1 Tax=Streptomyces sp. SCUT-3 TaxID=2684469 RepID=UPI0015F9E318|nr:response regulator transcription factor [Streptomyces sp. SCUT-3]QMV21962.1 response regulator [Streptomyces sp. SCUT-3]